MEAKPSIANPPAAVQAAHRSANQIGEAIAEQAFRSRRAVTFSSKEDYARHVADLLRNNASEVAPCNSHAVLVEALREMQAVADANPHTSIAHYLENWPKIRAAHAAVKA